MWQELIDVLEEITAYYRQLFRIAEKKRKALVAVDLKSLDGIIKEEQETIAKVEAAEQRRKKILLRMSASSPSIRPGMKLKETYAYCPSAALRAKLQDVHKTLDGLTQEVARMGENNGILIQGALSAVNYRLNQLSQAAVEPSYGRHGQEVVSQQKKFDFRA